MTRSRGPGRSGWTEWGHPTGLLFGLWCCLAAFGCRATPTVERDPTALFQTDSLVYVLEQDEVGYSTTIGFTFRNDTGGPVVLAANCRGDVRPRLEVLRNGKWFDAWTPFQEECDGDPLVIPPGALRTDTLRVRGASPGSNLLPAFVFSEVEGVYRMVWFQAYGTYDPGPPPEGTRLPLEQRISNSFTLLR